MADESVPEDILALAQERSRARGLRDWDSADRLKSSIEAAGWRIVDEGLAFSLVPTRPADMLIDGSTWYGSAESIASRLDDAATSTATVIVTAPDSGVWLEGILDDLAAHLPGDVDTIAVGPGERLPDGPATEVLRTARPFAPGEAIEAGLRRSRGRVVVVLAAERRPTGDVVSPLVAALADASVAVAGADGLRSTDLRRYQPAAPGRVTAVGPGCYAVRRADAIAAGEIDRRLNLPSSVAVWLSLTLRDRGPAAPPLQALTVALPLAAAPEAMPPGDLARLARRDGYRLAERFEERTWLAGDEPPQGRLVGDGAGDDGEHDERDDPGYAREP